MRCPSSLTLGGAGIFLSQEKVKTPPRESKVVRSGLRNSGPVPSVTYARPRVNRHRQRSTTGTRKARRMRTHFRRRKAEQDARQRARLAAATTDRQRLDASFDLLRAGLAALPSSEADTLCREVADYLTGRAMEARDRITKGATL